MPSNSVALPLLLLLSLTTTPSFTSAYQWFSNLDQPFNFTCPHGQFLSRYQSAYDGRTNDRHFSFSCRNITVDAVVDSCTWSDYVNDYDAPVLFQCPNDGVLTGIYGVHDNSKEDRRFRFHCCEVRGYITHACVFTPYENNFHGVVDYSVPDHWYMRGVESVHDNGQEDRITRFDICKLDRFYQEEEFIVG